MSKNGMKKRKEVDAQARKDYYSGIYNNTFVEQYAGLYQRYWLTAQFHDRIYSDF